MSKVETTRKVNVVFAGDIAWNKDIILDANNIPINEKTSPGGAAYYSAVGASHFSRHVGTVGRVGPDFDLSLLSNRGIDVEGVEVIPGGETCRFVLTQRQDNIRGFHAERGVAGIVKPSDFPDSYLQAQYIHLPTQLPRHSLTWLEYFSQKDYQGKVAVDSFEAFVIKFPGLTRKMFEKADIIFTNEAELEMLKQLGGFSFNKPVILKRGKHGAVYLHGDQTIVVPAPDVTVVETTGAGDMLAGAFLALRSRGKSVHESLQMAVDLASRSVTEFGVDHLPSREYMKQHAEKVTTAIVFDQHGRILLGRSPNFSGKLVLPGGHYLKGESPKKCISREIWEEMGIKVDPSQWQFLRYHESFLDDYKGRGAFFVSRDFMVTLRSPRVVMDPFEYTDYCFMQPTEALLLTDLHESARNTIEYYYKSNNA